MMGRKVMPRSPEKVCRQDLQVQLLLEMLLLAAPRTPVPGLLCMTKVSAYPKSGKPRVFSQKLRAVQCEVYCISATSRYQTSP